MGASPGASLASFWASRKKLAAGAAKRPMKKANDMRWMSTVKRKYAKITTPVTTRITEILA